MPSDGFLTFSNTMHRTIPLWSPGIRAGVNRQDALQEARLWRSLLTIDAGVWDSGARCSTLRTEDHHGALELASKHRISLNLSSEEYREVAALAEKARVSRAWIGRQALIEFLERHRARDIQFPLDLAATSERGRSR